MIRLVIFDLDGTLIDSAQDICEAANKTLSFYGIPHLSMDVIRDHIGEGFGSFVQHVAGRGVASKEKLEEIFLKFQSFYDQQLLKHTAFYAGVENFLGSYMSKPERLLGVISNKPEYQVRLILQGLGVEHKKLVEIYGGDRFEVKKPHPKPLLEMMKLAGCRPDETVMIGDSRADVEAAKSAGTHFIAVSFGYNSPEKLKEYGAEKFIYHYDELLEKIEILTDLKLN